MRFSLVFDLAARGGLGEDGLRMLLDLARLVDDSPIRAIWIPDGTGCPSADPAVFAAAVAVHTATVGIRGYGIQTPVPSRERLVGNWSVVDGLSGGRVELAFAAAGATGLRDVDEVCRQWPGPAELPVWMVARTAAQWRQLDRSSARVLTTPGQVGSAAFTRWSALRGDRPGPAVLMYAFAGASDREAVAATTEPLRRHLRRGVRSGACAEGAVRSEGAARSGACAQGAVRSEDAARSGASVEGAMRSGASVEGAMRSAATTGRAVRSEAAVERAVRDVQARHGLIGGAATLHARLDALAARGVGEVACLVDFGVDAEATERGIHRLCALAEQFQAGPRW
ncbi:hypothetical protein [Actinoplanes rectilineatus]|uniref:hypothetical protein n=1 Tax=Actinoplanes rectilineatus TaxID=113571 RepID=UPI0005F2D825|nr:hypothetical protein [Actinoplanes rectilineatus]